MNPRHRRLLIPGLLLILIVVVVIASISGRAEAADQAGSSAQVSVLSDPRIVEASGLALSARYDDLGYVINDSGQAQVVFAVTISTGEVVGTTTVTGETWRDSEALSIDDDGTLWVADTGDNLVARTDAALYAFDEPGPGDSTVAATRYQVTYDDGPANVEALVIQPGTGAKFLISKGFVSGDVYALPSSLSSSEANRAERVGRAPAVVTDGAFTPDGTRVLLRTYLDVRVLDPSDWDQIRSIDTPPMSQSETLAVEAEGRSFLVGSEGAASPLIRVEIPTGTEPTATPTPTPTAAPVPIDDDGVPRPDQGFAGRAWFGAGFGLLALVLISAWVARQR